VRRVVGVVWLGLHGLGVAGRLGLTMAVAALSMAGCAVSIDDNANGGLGGTSWTVTSIDGRPTLAEARPTIRFAVEGTVSGTSGCNQFSGPFRTDGERLVVGDLMSTKIGCDAPRGAQEQAFFAALAGARGWRLTADGSLELGGAVPIVLHPA
jgi:putative lipoprotein